MRKGKGKTKSHRVFRRGTERVFFFGHTTDKNVANQKRETRKIQRRMNTIRDSAYAIEQKKRDIAAAEARDQARIASESARRSMIASLLPPMSKHLIHRASRSKKPNSLEEALKEEAEKAAEKEIRDALRAERAKEKRRLFEETQKAKKEIKREKAAEGKRRHEKTLKVKAIKNLYKRKEEKYKLSHVSYEGLEKEMYEKYLAAGLDDDEAKRRAAFYAIYKADPDIRQLEKLTTKWGDFALDATPPPIKKETVKPLKPLEPEPSSRVISRVRVPRIVSPTFRTLVISNIPQGRDQIDKKKLFKTISGILRGKEIFGISMLPESAVRLRIDIYKGSGEKHTGDRYSPKEGEIVRILAFINYSTHEQAQAVLDYHRRNPIRVKGSVVDIAPGHVK
jgi:hypothetical protein